MTQIASSGIRWGSIGGQTFLEPKSVTLAAALSLATSLSTFNGPSFESWVVWIFGNFVSFAILAIPIGIFWRARSKSPELVLSWQVVLLSSAALGFLKSSAVYVFYYLVIGQAFSIGETLARGLVGSLIGLTTLPILSLASMALREVRELNQRVLDRKRILEADSLGQSPSELLSDLQHKISSLLSELQGLDQLKLTTSEIQKLRLLIENSVRPASHAFWNEANTRDRALGRAGLIRLAMSRPFWIAPVIAPLAVGSIVSQSQEFGIIAALQQIFIVTFISALALWAMNQLVSFRKKAPRVWFALGVALAGPVAWIFSVLLSQDFQPHYLRWLIGYSAWLCIGSIFASAARLMVEERNQLANQLKRLRQLDGRSDVALRREYKRRANQLHGEVQSKLVSTVLLAEAGEQIDRTVLLGQLRGIQNLLGGEHQLEKSLIESLEGLKVRWQGFIEISFAVPDLPINPSIQREIFLVVEEAVQNSYRHGLADNCDIKVEIDNSSILLTIVDNGVGSRGGSPGLGSALFAEHDENWNLLPAENGGSRLTLKMDIFV